MSDSLQPHELQHARLPCPSLSLGACSNSCPESRQCHPTISSFVAPFPSCTQSFPASGSFPVGQLFASCGQRIRASASVFPMNTQGWFPLGLTDLISLLSKVLSRVFSCTTIWKHKFFSAQPSLWSNSHIHTWLQEKSKQTIALTIWTFVSKMMFLLLNMLSMLDIAFLPRSKRLLFSWLYSLSTVILEPKTRVFPWSSKSSYSSLLALTPKILKDCCCSVTKSCSTLCNPMNSSTPGFLVLHYLLEFAQIHVCWVSDAIQPSYLPSSPSPPALNLSQNQGLSSESVLHIRQPKYWSSSFSISPSNEYSGLISFTTDWFDLLATQGTLKASPTPQFESINSSELSLLYGPALISIWLLEKP